MPQLLTLSRAAQLLGTTRGALQKRIRDGELFAHDGNVAAEELLRLYPELNLEDAGAFERVVQIKEQAFGKRVRSRMLPSQEVLAQRLFAQGQEVAELRRHLARYHELVVALRDKIDTVGGEGAAALGRLLDEGLAAVLGSQEPADKVVAMDEMLRVVTAHVSVKPSGHEFFVEGSETVLAAALRSGLSPAYGCGNGNCGLCKARIVSGEVQQVRPFDYQLSAAERAQNVTLLCSHTAVSDLVLEMIEAESPDDIPEQEIVTRVRSVAPLDGETLLLHLQTPRTNRLRFLAGQSVTLGAVISNADFHADYPLASCPCDDRNLLFHIPRNAADGFAQRLFEGAIKSGDAVNVRGPSGDFVLKRDSTRPLAFLCCDTGFAPIRSLAEHAMAVDRVPAMAVYWATTRPGGQYLANQCRAWADALDDFRYRAFEPADAAAAGRTAAAALTADLGTDFDAYVCGPEAFVEAAAAALRAAGVGADRQAALVV